MLTKHRWILLILIAAIFLRAFNFADYYIFEHDQDLYSWIVKDILVDHHIRLIGQETSIDGLFIGPLFYYLLVPFYWIGRMDPLMALYPALLISSATLISFYWIGNKLFGQKIALTASLLYAFSMGVVLYDRWIVPTLPTLLWSVWFFYLVMTIHLTRKINWLLMGVLLGLVWHIHIALAPLFLMIPFLKPKIEFNKEFFKGVSICLLLLTPFFLFEVRHHFQQTIGVFHSIGLDRGEVKGFARVVKVFDAFSRIQLSLWLPDYGPFLPRNFIFLTGFIFLILAFFSRIKKIALLWIVIILIAQIMTTRSVSEYYFASSWIITIFVVSFLFSKRFLIPVLIILIGINSYLLLTRLPLGNSYQVKAEVVDYLKADASQNGYQCIGINYIADPGTKVGYRYLAWKKDLHLVQPGDGIAVYSIVSPWDRSPNETKNHRFGNIGVIPATPTEVDSSHCTSPSDQLLPLLGFTK